MKRLGRNQERKHWDKPHWESLFTSATYRVNWLEFLVFIKVTSPVCWWRVKCALPDQHWYLPMLINKRNTLLIKQCKYPPLLSLPSWVLQEYSASVGKTWVSKFLSVSVCVWERACACVCVCSSTSPDPDVRRSLSLCACIWCCSIILWSARTSLIFMPTFCCCCCCSTSSAVDPLENGMMRLKGLIQKNTFPTSSV